MAKIAYIRVSTIKQSTQRQEVLAEEADRVFREKVSAKDTDRPELQSLLSYMREGDEVSVYSLDRLSRKLSDLLGLVELFREKGVTLHFRKEAITVRPGEADLTSTLILSIFGALAEWELANITERRAEGVAAARAQGKQVGRKRALSPEQVEAAAAEVEGGKTIAAAAAALGVSRSALSVALKAYRGKR